MNPCLPFSESGLLALLHALPFLAPVPLMGRIRRRRLGPRKPQGRSRGKCKLGKCVHRGPGSGGCLPGVPAVPGDLLDLRSMIEKVTGKNALTNYGFYGCYCGWGGRGTPKDDTDW